MVNSKSLNNQTIVALGERIKTGEISPVEVVTACLEQIKKHNSTVNAFITVLHDEALRAAQQAETEIKEGKWRGPLHGIPVAIKDFYDTAGTKTTAAFEHFKNRVPATDAPTVAKLKAAGAIIIGKTNMHTLGMGTTGTTSYFGAVHNPWNLNYIAGGSSSGSAAAIASGMCYATFDTDAVGSCRLPAACCGVVGFKGSYGLIDNSGILEGTGPADPSIVLLGHAGIMTRSVLDTALVVSVLTTKEGNLFSSLESTQPALRVAIPSNLSVSTEIKQLFEAALDELGKSIGSTLSKIEVPFDNPGFDISNIETDRAAINDRLFKDVDVIVLPTTVDTTPTIASVGEDAQALSPQNTLFANYYGLPAVSIRCGFDSRGLPAGIQFVAGFLQDKKALQAAGQFEQTVQANEWFTRRPLD